MTLQQVPAAGSNTGKGIPMTPVGITIFIVICIAIVVLYFIKH